MVKTPLISWHVESAIKRTSSKRQNLRIKLEKWEKNAFVSPDTTGQGKLSWMSSGLGDTTAEILEGCITPNNDPIFATFAYISPNILDLERIRALYGSGVDENIRAVLYDITHRIADEFFLARQPFSCLARLHTRSGRHFIFCSAVFRGSLRWREIYAPPASAFSKYYNPELEAVTQRIGTETIPPEIWLPKTLRK